MDDELLLSVSPVIEMAPLVVEIEIADPVPKLPSKTPQWWLVLVWLAATFPKMVTEPVVAVMPEPLIISTPTPWPARLVPLDA